MSEMDLERLDTYLEEVLIPNYIKTKITNNKQRKKLSFYIQEKDLLALDLKKMELEYIKNYLRAQHIWIKEDNVKISEGQSLIKSIEQNELMKKIKEYKRTKNIKLRDEIITNNIPLVRYLAYKYAIYAQIDKEELESFGYEGLMIALEKYNLNSNTLFSTFAFHYIKCYILKGISESKGFGKQHLYEKYRNSLKEVLEEDDKCNLSGEQILEKIASKMAGEKDNFKNSVSYYYVLLKNTISLEDLKEEEEKENHIKSLERNFIEDPYCDMEPKLLRKDLEDALSLLTEREEDIIRLYFGLDENEFLPQELNKIAQIQKVSPERIRQIKERALEKLKSSPKLVKTRKKLKEYL